MLSYFIYSLFLYTIPLFAAQEDSYIVDLTPYLDFQHIQQEQQEKYNQLILGIETSDVDKVMSNFDFFEGISNNSYFHQEKVRLLEYAHSRYELHKELSQKIKKEASIKDKVYSALTLYSVINFFSIALSDNVPGCCEEYRTRHLFSSCGFALMCTYNMYATQDQIINAQQKCADAELIKNLLHADTDFHLN